MMKELKDIKKIAVFRALQLGDMLCSIPAIKALRNAYPSASITLLGLPWASTLVERFNNYFDQFLHFPGYPGLPEQPFNEEELESFLRKMRKENYDLLLQMQGNGTIVNRLVFQMGAKNVAGFYNGESHVNSPFFIKYPEKLPEVERHLALIKHLGIRSQGKHLEFPVTAKDQKDFDGLLLPVFPKNYICFHPGSRGSLRQWPTKYFARIADHCIEKGFSAVITGTKAESDITSDVLKCMHYNAIDLTGKTTPGAIAILIKNSFALVSNCTGVAHIADALDTPSVVISMDGEPDRWGPLDRRLHRVIDWTNDPHFESVLLETEDIINRHVVAGKRT